MDKNSNTYKWLPSAHAESAVQFVITTIRKALENGDLKPGDQVPSENELSNAMSISRSPIREAMKILEAFGVVEIRRGRGTFITSNVEDMTLDPILFNFILMKPSTQEMLEFREMLEYVVNSDAIRYATDEDISKLDESLEKIKSGKYTYQETAQLDLEFHALLGGLVTNRLIRKTYAFAMNFFASSIVETYRRQNQADYTIMVHDLIIKAIKKRDLDAVPDIVRANSQAWKPDKQ